MIIDSHVHVYPNKVAKAAGEGISQFYHGAPVRYLGTINELFAAGRTAGVEKFLIFSTATTLQQVIPINNFIIDACQNNTQLYGAGSMYPGFLHFEQELTRLQKAGILGVKLHPDFQQFDADDPIMFPFYEALARHNMFLLIHSGDFRYDFSHPRRIAAVARRYPTMPIIAAHFGGWMRWVEGREFLAKLENIWVDSSSTIGFVGQEPAQLAIRAFGAERIFFGTDFPMWDMEEEIQRIRDLGLSEKDTEGILGGNFSSFWHMLAAMQDKITEL